MINNVSVINYQEVPADKRDLLICLNDVLSSEQLDVLYKDSKSDNFEDIIEYMHKIYQTFLVGPGSPFLQYAFLFRTKEDLMLFKLKWT